MRYEVDAGGHRVRIEASLDGRMTVDGSVRAYDLREVAPGRWTVILEGRSLEVAALEGTVPAGAAGRWLVDGREAKVLVRDERTAGAGGERATHAGRHDVRAPMPGLLKAMHVSEGDVVERGDALATLEAMKMENELRAPARGRVERVAVAAGTKVERGALIAVVVERE